METITHHSGAQCKVSLVGGQVVSYTSCHGEEFLYLSSKAVLNTPGKAIRGGIPICWPQFGPGALPQHGFARNSVWTLSKKEDGAGVFTLKENEATLKAWPHSFLLAMRVTVGPESFSVELSCTNTGADPIAFTAALHTYFAVPDVKTVKVAGLQGLEYEDKLDGNKIKTETAENLVIAGPVDRVYHSKSPNTTNIAIPGASGRRIQATGFGDIVVWNPWQEGAAKMADVGEGEWQKFVCVEAVAARAPITVLPGKSWTGTQTITADPAPRLQ